jgi:hypothetical protein
MSKFLIATPDEPISLEELMKKIELSDSVAYSKILRAAVNGRDIGPLEENAKCVILDIHDVVVFYPKEGEKFPTDIAFGV